MHLARGRLLAQGEWTLGMAAPVGSGLPANSSWLYDLVCYGLYSLLGETGLVLSKAVVVVILALLLWRLSRSDRERWVAAFCTALALLAMSVRLPLAPVTVSYLFLALALWMLHQRGRCREPSGTESGESSGTESGSARRTYQHGEAARWPSPWPLLVLFVVWANTDGWFVLGLAVVALTWLGQALEEVAGARQRGETGVALFARRGLCLALLTAACLLNPRHFHALALPPELQSLELAAPVADAPGSPFEKTYLTHRGLTPAGLAYFPLLALSLVSFVINYSRWSWQRFLPWLGVALLSVVQGKAVPFFAVVAGPVLAWNLQDCLERRRQESVAWHRGRLLGRALTWTFLGILPVLARPGWLQSPPFEPRRWTIETHPALAHGAAAVRAWIEKGQCDAQARGLHLSPDTVHAFAWFCPEAKGLRDEELSFALQSDRAADAATMARLRAAGIDYAVVYDSNRDRFLAAVGNFFNDPRQWSLLHLEGYLAIFGWRDPSHANSDPFRGRRLDLNRLAFHPTAEKRAPEKAPEQEPQTRVWWEAFYKPIPPRPLDQEEATLHLLQADVRARSAPQRHAHLWISSQFAALLGAAGGWTGPTALVEARQRWALLQPWTPGQKGSFTEIPGVDRLAYALRMQFYHAHDDVSPAPLYLAVRAARRALAVNPDAAQAYLVLGQAYLRLLHNTRERVWGEAWPELFQLRRCQACTALTQAVLLKPDFAEAHYRLYQLYAEMNCLDLALEHLRKYVELLQKAGPGPGESVEQLREQLAFHQDQAMRLADEIEQRESRFLLTAARWKVGNRAKKAWEEGLAGKARDLLLQSDISAFGAEGMILELELLLQTGEARKVLDWPAAEQKAAMGTYYRLLRIQALAALGDYALACEACNELSGSLAQAAPGRDAVLLRALMAKEIGQLFLSEQSEPRSIGELLLRVRVRFLSRQHLNGLASDLRKEADMATFRGLLALEQGDADEAEIAFRQALSVWKNQAAAAAGEGLDFNARKLAQGYLQWLTQPPENE
jgi:tetratricopeptide (TPR) repeat protein